ncbi:hypothetical protein BDA99DRAFT_521225 [Phascolomyces articulosus]|uniref:F-box domain-containing protein n=1 Tax=Phascolomyces articulosus TaxID=60185 RepID=A0AAD5JSP4_9FUNG|nr:hypothetical protein BDA99DRAFT_521225 [Phascolomyces articulosus]
MTITEIAIGKLPVELIDLIATYLTLSDYFNCTLVSKEWQHVFRHCYRYTVNIKKRSTFTSMVHSLNISAKEEPCDPLGHVIRAIKIDDGVACLKEMVRLYDLCPHIHSLTFRYAYSAAHNERLFNAYNNNHNDKQRVSRRRFFSTPTPFLNAMKGIKRLTLEPRPRASVVKHIRCSGQDLSYYLSAGSHLRRLTLLGVIPQLMAEHLETIHASCPNLSELHITTNFSLSNSINVSTMTTATNDHHSNDNNLITSSPAYSLENLYIRCSRRETSPETFYHWFGYFGLKYPNMRHLCLEYKNNVSRVPTSFNDQEAIRHYTLFTTNCTKLESTQWINLPLHFSHLPFLFGNNSPIHNKIMNNDNTISLSSTLTTHNSTTTTHHHHHSNSTNTIFHHHDIYHDNNYNVHDNVDDENNTQQLRYVNFVSEDYTVGDIDPARLAELFIRLRNMKRLHLCVPMTITSTACLSILPYLWHLTVLKLIRNEKSGSIESNEPFSNITMMVDDLLEQCPNLKELTLSHFIVRTHQSAHVSWDYHQDRTAHTGVKKVQDEGGKKGRRVGGYPLETLTLVKSSISESCGSFFAYKCPSIQNVGLYTCIYYDESGCGISRFKIHMPYHELKTLHIINPRTVHSVPLEWNRELLSDMGHTKLITVRSLMADHHLVQQQDIKIPDESFTVDGLNFFTKWYFDASKCRFFGELNMLRHYPPPHRNHNGTTGTFMHMNDSLLTAQRIFENTVPSPSIVQHHASWKESCVALNELQVSNLYKRIKQSCGFPQYHRQENYDKDDDSSSSKRRRLMTMDDPEDMNRIIPDRTVTLCHNEAEETGFLTICCKSIEALSVNGILLVANDVYNP